MHTADPQSKAPISGPATEEHEIIPDDEGTQQIDRASIFGDDEEASDEVTNIVERPDDL